MGIKENIEEVLENIKKYSKSSTKVKMIVASKYVDYKGVEEVFEAGARYFGENRVQSFVEKYENIKNTDYKWHFIGHLQKNKVKYIIDKIDLIHSVDTLPLAVEIDKRAKAIGKCVDVLLEVNISKEESKHGFYEDDVKLDIKEMKKLENINVIGLMTMAPLSDNENEIREVFRKLKELKKELNELENLELTELSMGMTNDYKIALEEGATLIRVGSAIFK